jgi:AmmeMemoRadiSam system protein B
VGFAAHARRYLQQGGDVTNVRRPVAAGSFYPSSVDALAATVDELLAAASEAGRSGVPRGALRGLIVPHAGYIYSGPVAATAYRLLPMLVPPPSVVVILGPSHFEPLDGLAVAPHDAWDTPLGSVSLDDGLRRALVRAGAMVDARPHLAEHSIEVQLPFLQRCLPGVPVVPLAVGACRPTVAADQLRAALPESALVLVSTDLSHYHDDVTARELDARTAAAIEALDSGQLRSDDACGVDAVRVSLAWARSAGHRIVRLDLRTSADTAGDWQRVVGYGAFAVVDV